MTEKIYTSLERGIDEDFEAYKARRKESTKAVKALKRGKEFWDSSYAGTFVNHEKRELKKQRAAKRAAKRGNIN
jgi:siroheme synthase (precorrin-2 oxidase/ferrochelatase)